MNGFDPTIILFLNRLSHRSTFLDALAVWIANGAAVKGLFMAFFVVMPWFDGSPRRGRSRAIVLATLMGMVAAIALGLTIQHLLPHRLRPIQQTTLPFAMLSGQLSLDGWPSSFPSDHAILFGAIGAGCLAIRRRLGVAALLYGFALVGLPRVYCGIHYPSDILAGAVLGAAVVALVLASPVREKLCAPIAARLSRHESATTVGLFVTCQLVAVAFVDTRWLLRILMAAVEHRLRAS